MEPGFHLEGEDIDPAELERELSRRVEQRKASGIYSRDVEVKLADRLPDELGTGMLPPIAELDYSATLAGTTWEVSTAYPVSTDKRSLKPLILFAKRLARLWARIAVGPIQREQSVFNRHVADALDALRRYAISQRSEQSATEADLSELAEAMIKPGEDEFMVSGLVEALGATGSLTVLSPCSSGLVQELEEAGFSVLLVGSGSTWDTPSSPAVRTEGPVSFLSQVEEGSLRSILFPELAFWLRPEKIIALARKGYLALSPGGLLAIAVHGFASRAAAPAWCDPLVVERALELAGFEERRTLAPKGGGDGYLALARKPV